ncbi:MAG: cobalt-precorrin-4/precorrin-4 C(11)-methyltransferase [Methanomicrobiales archaeon]|nr:cobalt-precorrin-4/precorrin-4 C(11)-methyltransferase [Methanomicrobiales archaeon]
MRPVYIVGAGPGDPGLITVRGLELLHSADVLVYTGSLVNPALVARSPAAVKANSHGMQLADLVSLMAGHVRAGRTVVRLHTGDPSLFGAIVEQIEGLRAEGIGVEIVPGVSSMNAAAAALGTQLTLKDVAEALIVARPAGKTLEADEIREFSRHRATLVIFLGTERLEEVLSRLECPPATPAAVVYHASWPDQKIVTGTVADVAAKARAAGIERTALLIIGGVVDPGSAQRRRSVLYS